MSPQMMIDLLRELDADRRREGRGSGHSSTAGRIVRGSAR
jgi:hypothetical protein